MAVKQLTSEASSEKKPGHWRDVFLFLLCSLSCMGFVFRSALWNGSLLAPLDIAPALYANFHWMDSSQDAIPLNHYTVDIFDHELPRQYAIYRGIRGGEFPWWDPYTQGGRPLVAEAHISGTDGVRLILYRFLPFVPAYNLTKLFNSLALGLGTFLLLRQFGRSTWLSIAGGLACQFAGSYTLFQTPLAVSASATWYPWIWLAWARYMTGRRMGWIIMAGLFVGLSIAAGNQQTHAFLAVFGGCFLAGHVWHDRAGLKPALGVALVSCLLGVLLALPVLVPQIQLYLLCERRPAFVEFTRIQTLTGVASLAGLFPWAFGTFRTLDASKLFGQGTLGFCVFIGCAALILSCLQATRVFRKSTRTVETSVSVMLVLAYLVICSTPLVAIFYARLATLATVGLVVLAVGGAEDLIEGKLSPARRQLGTILTAGVWIAFIGCNALAFLVYPRIEARVESAFLEKQQANPAFASAPDLRRYQVRNLPREISVLNPATVLGVSSATALALALWSSGRRRSTWLTLALILNLMPELDFAERFTVKSPIVLWDRLQQGGPEQQRALDLLHGGLRLHEEVTGRFDRLFPGAIPDLYRVHSLDGYSSFALPDLALSLKAQLPNAILQDIIYRNETSGSSTGKLILNETPDASARFQWENHSRRRTRVVDETLNSVTVDVEAGEPGVLWRTDRFYPGWKLASPKMETRIVARQFLTVQVPAGRQTLAFRYHPPLLLQTLAVSSVTAVACLGCLFLDARRKNDPVNPQEARATAGQPSGCRNVGESTVPAGPTAGAAR